MKKFTLFLTLAVAVANMPVAAMQTKMTVTEANKAANKIIDEIIKTAGERAKRTTARKALDSVTVAAQGAKSMVAEFATDILNDLTDGVYSLDSKVESAVAPEATVKSRIRNAAQSAQSAVAGAKSAVVETTTDMLNDLTDGVYSLDSAQDANIAAKKATILARLTPDMYNPVSNSTAVALTGAAAATALAYWYAPYAPAYVAPTCFDAANMGTACQTTADICGVCKPYVQSFWESLRNIKFGC